MCDKPNYRHVQVQCCASCRHYRCTFEDEPVCVQGVPSVEPTWGGWPLQEGAVTVQPLGICDAYAPQQGGPVCDEKATVQAGGGGGELDNRPEFWTFGQMNSAKLDALTELVEAMAGAMVNGTPSGQHGLGRLLARRRGECEVCLGTRGGPSGQSMDGRWGTAPCHACNGTGKAPGAEAKPDTDPPKGQCHECTHLDLARDPDHCFCAIRQKRVVRFDHCEDFHRREGGPHA